MVSCVLSFSGFSKLFNRMVRSQDQAWSSKEVVLDNYNPSHVMSGGEGSLEMTLDRFVTFSTFVGMPM